MFAWNYPIVMQEPVELISWLHIHFLVYKLRVLYYSLKRKWMFVKTVSSVLMLLWIQVLKFSINICIYMCV